MGDEGRKGGGEIVLPQAKGHQCTKEVSTTTATPGACQQRRVVLLLDISLPLQEGVKRRLTRDGAPTKPSPSGNGGRGIEKIYQHEQVKNILENLGRNKKSERNDTLCEPQGAISNSLLILILNRNNGRQVKKTDSEGKKKRATRVRLLFLSKTGYIVYVTIQFSQFPWWVSPRSNLAAARKIEK